MWDKQKIFERSLANRAHFVTSKVSKNQRLLANVVSEHHDPKKTVALSWRYTSMESKRIYKNIVSSINSLIKIDWSILRATRMSHEHWANNEGFWDAQIWSDHIQKMGVILNYRQRQRQLKNLKIVSHLKSTLARPLFLQMIVSAKQLAFLRHPSCHHDSLFFYFVCSDS